MKYIVHRRFKSYDAISGYVNIPALTECPVIDNIIYYKEKPVCYITSENAHQYFAINIDGKGLERGRLTQQIQKILSSKDPEHKSRWGKLWNDSKCLLYKREEYDDYWLWNHSFFNAPVEDLHYILSVVIK